MKIEAKKIRIEFSNSSEDYWEASCESGLELDEAIRMITRAWEEHDASAEPLIKDEKIRKAVRAFWEAIPDAVTDKRILYKKNQDLAVGVYSIYCGAIHPETLEVGKMYTITELCGDEEAPEPIEPTFIDLDERIKEKGKE